MSALVLLVGCAAASSRQVDAADFVTVELGSVVLDRTRGAPVVLLREPGSERVLPIMVGLAEAHAIARALHGIEPPRPMTHDLLAGLLRRIGVTVIEVQVHDLRDGIYIGRLRMRLADAAAVQDVDSRPSDALALALRLDVPIRVRRGLLRDGPDGEAPPAEDDPGRVRTIELTDAAVTAPDPA